MPRPLPRIVAVLALLHAYIGWRLLPALALGVPGWSVGVILLTLSTLLMPLSLFAGMLTHRRTLADRLSGIGALAMGLFSSLLVLTLLRDLALAVLPGWFGVAVSAAAVPLLALLVTLIGLVNARRIARVLDIDVAIDGLAPALDGFTIVQLSDIHVGATIKSAYVAAIVGRVNTLDADLVAITGDVVDGGVPQLRAHTAPLAGLRSRHGSFLVTGNHEYYSGADAWVAEFTRIGLRVLMNEHVVIEHDGAALVLAGVTDFSAGHHDPAHRSDPQRALVGAPAGLTRVLLAHQPRSAEAAEAAGFDLQLSGHTHGGQFWPWNLFVRLQQPYTAGLHRLRRLWVYTSRGTGYWGPPKRFGAPAEITRIRLRPA
ncbi:MAG TPA: serine/threonine protein phosphatase [Janthinobacterium sp.]|nr:serine/threonine protein phosphatase [Janthinobacterium sp.]